MAVVVRYGEIALKGKNRSFFEKKLVKNIKECLKRNKADFEKVFRIRGRIIIETEDNCNCLRNVFGITSFSRATVVELDLEKIKKAALILYTAGSFKINSRRLQKIFMPSQKINEEVGAFIVKKKKAKVNLEHPDVEIGIEIMNDRVYLFNKKEKGTGGMPSGTGGKVAVLLENEDSLEAALRMLKRGCSLVLVEKEKINFESLKKYCYGFKLMSVKKIPTDALAVVVADKLENMKERKSIKKPVLTPLIIA